MFCNLCSYIWNFHPVKSPAGCYETYTISCVQITSNNFINYVVLLIVLHTKKFLNNEIQRAQNYVLLKADFTA